MEQGTIKNRLSTLTTTLGLALGIATPAQAAIEISISDSVNTFVCVDTTTKYSGCTVTGGTVFDTLEQEVVPFTAPATSGVITGSTFGTIDGPDGYGLLGDLDEDPNELEADTRGLGNWNRIFLKVAGAQDSTLQTIESFFILYCFRKYVVKKN